ncbi:MAG: hypothetical protein ABSE35_01060 [Bryobacteraceae bacterium]|jgi:hypothetical protein
MKQEAAFFDGKEPVLIYIAKRLRDALKLEALLTEASLDYGVEADEYRGGIIFATTRTGAFFYVLPDCEPAALEIMRRGGYKPYAGAAGRALPPANRPGI